MDIKGEQRIPAPRDKVWAALNDPEVLKASLPGCESFKKTGDNSFAAKVTAKVGPVKSTFNGEVTLSDIKPLESYAINGEGKGGAAGFAKGGARVALREDGDATVLSYDVKADVGGKLAQLGSRVLDGTAKKLADQFFTSFSEQVAPTPAVAESAPAAPVPAGAAPLSQNRFVWVSLAILLLMMLVMLGR